MANMSVFGPKYDLTNSINSFFKQAMHLRRNTRLNAFNSVFTGFPVGLFIEGTAAQGNATNGDMKIQNCVMSGMGSFFKSSFERDFFKTPAFNNDTLATNDLLLYIDPFNLSQPNFLLQTQSELNTGSIWDNTGLKYNQKKAFAVTVYPNPVSKNATLTLNLEKPNTVTISVFDMIGHKVATIAQKQYVAGLNEIKYDASSLPKGIYFVQVTDGVKNSSVKMIVK
jgi:hypothetical protein